MVLHMVHVRGMEGCCGGVDGLTEVRGEGERKRRVRVTIVAPSTVKNEKTATSLNIRQVQY